MDNRTVGYGSKLGALNGQRETRCRCKGHNANHAGGSATRRANGARRLPRRVDTAVHAPDCAETDHDEEENPDDPPHARYSSTSAGEGCHHGHAGETGGDMRQVAARLGVQWQNGHGGQQPPLVTRDAAIAPVVTSAKTALANATSVCFISGSLLWHRLPDGHDRHGTLVHVEPAFKVKTLYLEVEFKVPYCFYGGNANW